MSRALPRLVVVLHVVAVITGLNANAHAGDPDQPLRPRAETPAEIEARKSRPQFAKPSELEGAEPAAVASVPASASAPPAAVATTVVAAAAPPSALLPERLFAIPRTYSYLSGYWRDWSGETLLQRPYASPDASEAAPRHASLFVRGFYYALDNELRDWSGVELIGSIDVTSRVGIAGGLRHELRDTTADQAVVSVSTLLGRDVAILGTFAAGNGAEFIPITELAAEARVRVAERQRLQYAFGAGVSWWSQTRRMIHLDAAGMFQYSKRFAAEYRLQFHRIDSDTATAHVFPRTTLAFLHGIDGNWLLQERITVGQAPLYGPGIDLAALTYKLSMDVGVGLRKWVAPTYGYIIGVDYGVQEDRYQRLGFDFAVFVQR